MTSSMIIPTMSGIFFGEKFSIWKFCVVIILIAFIYLSLDKSGEGKISRKWLMYCLLAFLCQGALGVLQKIHQSSAHKSEISGFLFAAFICSFVCCGMRFCHELHKHKTVRAVDESIVFSACKWQRDCFKFANVGDTL